MTTITLPPDLEGRLADEASRRGTTPELLALDGLRRLFAPRPEDDRTGEPGTLFDFLAGYIGTVAGSAEPYSENCGRRFAEACAQLDYLEGRAARGSREAYDRVLSKVPAAPPLPGDERSAYN
jgi:hypothetical protein